MVYWHNCLRQIDPYLSADRIRRRPLVAAFLLAVPLLMLAFVPRGVISLPVFPLADKLYHFMAFLIYTPILYCCYRFDSPKQAFQVILTIMLAGSIVSECLQPILSNRSFDILDIIANIIGSIMGSSIAFAIDSHYFSTNHKYTRAEHDPDSYWIARDEDDDEEAFSSLY